MSIFDKEDNITMEHLMDLGFHRFNIFTEDGNNTLLILTIQPVFKRPKIGGNIFFNTKIRAYGNVFEIRREIERNCFQFEKFTLNDNSDVDILIKRESDLLWALLDDQYPCMGETLKDIIYLNIT